MKTHKQRKQEKKRKLYLEKMKKQYPFLRNKRYSDWIIYDDMPRGWQKAFGELLLKDLRDILKKEGSQNEYHIFQIKEKFGQLRWYDNGSSKIQDLIGKYSYLSENVCINCGQFPVKMTSIYGWLSPYCKKCYNKIKKNHKNLEEYDDIDADLYVDGFDPIFKVITHKYDKEKDEYIKEEYTLDTTDICNRIKPKYRTDQDTHKIVTF